jgi:CAAX prenyl protease-like protein
MLAGAFVDESVRFYPVFVLVAATSLLYNWRSIVGFGTRQSCKPIMVGAARRSVMVAILGGIAVWALWIGLWYADSPSERPDPRQSLVGLPGWAIAIWLLFRIAGSLLVLPLIEEAAFRGYLLRRLTSADFESVSPRPLNWPALLISSALFGLLHDQWLAGFLAGAIYAGVYSFRGRLLDAVVAHGTTNGLLALAALVSGQWQFWS